MPNEVNILIADDQEGIRETLSDILEDKGYNVIKAEDGYKAIERVREIPFDIIFMDVKMPGIDGVKTFEEIKRIDSEVVVIMMTGYSVAGMIKEALEKGAYAVIYKPFDVNKLMKTIEKVGERGRNASS